MYPEQTEDNLHISGWEFSTKCSDPVAGLCDTAYCMLLENRFLISAAISEHYVANTK